MTRPRRVHLASLLAKLIFSFVFLSSILCSDAEAGPIAMFSVSDLGGGQAYAINASGQVVGQNAAGHAFLYGNGTMTDLGTLGGSSSFGLGINDSGKVVGWADNPGNTTQGFLYSNGAMVGLSPGAVTGGAQGINSSGQVVGWYSNSGSTPAGGALGPTQAFLYSNGVKTNLGSFPADSDTYPLSINNSGQVVGYTYQRGVTGEQPFIIQNGTTTILGVSGAFQMINASGQAVGGLYFSDTVWHAQLYSNGTLNDLGTLGGSNSWAYAINTAGEVVGDAYTANSADHAYLYSNGKMTDLNSLIDPNSGWTLETATGINDNGQIVGWGTNASGQTDAFLLTPTPTPEPSTFILFGIGLAGMTVYGWRRWKRVAA
jgi:probable HAF family extracellular repeat protein